MTTSVLLVGAGGIGSPFAIALADEVARGFKAIALHVADDDVVEESNLHRQILFRDEDVGRSKLDAFAERVNERAPSLLVTTHACRFTPRTAQELLNGIDLLVDATDNFASRFLAADAARLMRIPVVHAASVRWQATALACAPDGRPCYRCLFEDIPTGDAPDCATAGVVGPVCGVAGALAADLALRIIDGDHGAFGHITTYDGRRDRLRRVDVPARADCQLCGAAAGAIDLSAERYVAAPCAAD